MSVVDKLKPVESHVCGMPWTAKAIIDTLSPTSSVSRKQAVYNAYKQNCTIIDKALSGEWLKDAPLDSRDKNEEKLALFTAHLILDTAYIHQRLCQAGFDMERFPYDTLADKVLPKKEEDADEHD